MTTESVQFRQRLAEALSRGGLNERAVAAEVLMLLPAEFLTQYELLYLETWQKASGSISYGDENAENPVALKWRTSTNQIETRGTASKKGAGSISKGMGVKNQRAFAAKEYADRQLKKVAREIAKRLSDDDAPVRRCSGSRCRRIADNTWAYCPACGSPTQDEEA